MFLFLLRRVDNKIETSMKKMKAASFIGIILFVGIPLPTTGTWTAAAIASILRMRLIEALSGIFNRKYFVGAYCKFIIISYSVKYIMKVILLYILKCAKILL